ncbi:hypothetical protein DZE40_001975 [Clostridium beijerinckii]|nr:hypothetical protein [Clostridium beijerinckii]
MQFKLINKYMQLFKTLNKQITFIGLAYFRIAFK